MAQLVASSSAFLIVAGADGALGALNDNDDDDNDGPGVDDLGGARTTTELGLLSPVSISSSSSSSSVFCLCHISFFLLFLCDFVLINIFPVAFLSAVCLFFLLSSSPVIFTTPSLPAAPSQLSPKCGLFPLLLSPNWHSTFLSVQHPL